MYNIYNSLQHSYKQSLVLDFALFHNTLPN